MKSSTGSLKGVLVRQSPFELTSTTVNKYIYRRLVVQATLETGFRLWLIQN